MQPHLPHLDDTDANFTFPILVGDIGGHADHLHTGASLYVEQDLQGTRTLEAAAGTPVGPTAP